MGKKAKELEKAEQAKETLTTFYSLDEKEIDELIDAEMVKKRAKKRKKRTKKALEKAVKKLEKEVKKLKKKLK